jgi:hypothetical protein
MQNEIRSESSEIGGIGQARSFLGGSAQRHLARRQ